MHGRKTRIPFPCTGNSCRSQMAEGCATHPGGAWLQAASAGIEAHGRNPHAIAVLREAGVDISRRESHRVTPKILEQAERVATVRGQA